VELFTDGTMSFSDLPVKFEKSDVDRVLAQAQQQDALLIRLEKEMERNKEYLTKVCSLMCELPSTPSLSITRVEHSEHLSSIPVSALLVMCSCVRIILLFYNSKSLFSLGVILELHPVG
jgi:hypothetical protein